MTGARLRRLAEALHARAPRPVGEVLCHLAPDDRAAVLDLAERVVAWPAETVKADAFSALDADRYPPAPLRVVGGRS